MRRAQGTVGRWGRAGTALGALALTALAAVTPAGAAPTAGAPAPASPSPGCRATAVTPGEATVPISAGGRTGTYVRQVPTTYHPPTPMPVVFDFHGYAEPASLQVTLSALGDYGQQHGFITVTPAVTEPVPLWESTVGSPDLAFFGGLLDTVEQTLCVDQHRIFVTGYSNGAFMSSAIACQYAGRVAAVAPVAGIQALAHCHPSRPVPVVAFHGTADPFVHFDGSPSKAAADLPAPDGSRHTLGQSGPSSVRQPGPTVPAEAASWARRNRCGPTPVHVRVAVDVTLVRYRCPDHADVELYVVSGGGHAWPGSEGSKAIASVVGRTTFSVSADAVMWKFFTEHPLTARD